MNYFRWRKFKNAFFHALLILSAVLVLSPLLLTVFFVISKGLSSLDLNFFLNDPKPSGTLGGGMRHAILGTLYMVGIGALIAVPTGVLSGVYLSEFGKGKLAHLLRLSTDLLSGVPSIVVGIFAYILIVLPFKSFSALAGGVGLSVIILPIVIRSTEEILKLIPNHIREAGLALGLPRWKVTYFIVVRTSLSSLMTGIILGISRGAGETAPLLFTAFGSMHLSMELLEPMGSLPVQIYNYAISPQEDWNRQAWAGALVLITLVLCLNIVSRIILNRRAILNKITGRM